MIPFSKFSDTTIDHKSAKTYTGLIYTNFIREPISSPEGKGGMGFSYIWNVLFLRDRETERERDSKRDRTIKGFSYSIFQSFLSLMVYIQVRFVTNFNKL